MSMDVFRALIAEAISTMSAEELRIVILQTPDKELGTVGAAVLAEKKRIASDVGMSTPTIGATAPTKKSGTKTKKDTSCKQTPAAVKSPSKRKHDAIDLTSDTPEKISEEAQVDKGENHVSSRKNETIGISRNPHHRDEASGEWVIERISNVERISKVMERVDWTKVMCRADMIRAIFEGERAMTSRGGGAIKTIQDMTLFVDQNHAKLQSHPKFTALYQLAGPTFEDRMTGPSLLASNTGPALMAGPPPLTCQIRYPPFDWAVHMEKLKALEDSPDYPAKNEFYRNLNQMICSFYQDIINRCQTGYRNKFQVLVQDIHNMARLASDMTNKSTRELQKRLSTGEPISQLRDCMAAICSAILKHKTSIAKELDKKDRLGIRADLWDVNRILLRKGKSGLNSGLEKVTPLFEYEL